MYNSSLDISTFEFSQNPYKNYEELRKNGNVHFLKANNLWLIIGYNEIVEVLSNSKIFSSESENSFDAFLLNCDPPLHTKHKKILSGENSLLSQNRIDILESKNRIICREILNKVSLQKEFDILNDFSLPFSSLVILGLLGISNIDDEEVRNWSTDIILSESLYSNNFRKEKWEKLKPRVEEWINIASKKKDSEGLSEIIFHKDAIGNFSKEAILNLTKTLLLGGNETTPNLISSALLILLSDKRLYENVKNNPHLINNIINETLRLESPTQIIQRINKVEVTIGSSVIPANSVICLAIGAANRDPDVFEDPNEFVINRNGKILSFGYGPHYCIGSSLARQEAQIALEELFEHFPDLCISPTFKPIYRHSSHIRGLQKMLVTIKKDSLYSIALQRNKAITLINNGLNNIFEFPTFEFYNISEAKNKGWHITYPSPFIHANILYSLLYSDPRDNELLQKAKLFLLSSKETGGLWRFWKLENCQNGVPPDIDDTSMCSFVLEKLGHTINNRDIILKNIQNDGRFLTWILPNLSMLIHEPLLAIKLLSEKRIISKTIKAGMLHPNDSEIGVAANALMYLGESDSTKHAINYCIAAWKNNTDSHHFYEHKIVIAYHLARAFNEGVSSFIELSNSIENLIKNELDNFCFAELLLSYLTLKYFKTNSLLLNEVKNKIISKCQDNVELFEIYPYFTSKNRNYCAGSNCLTASWFLEATNDW